MITVLCGLIRNAHNQLFIARRAIHKSHPGLWEFPGGKLEPGETHSSCLARELWEELGMKIAVGAFVGDCKHEFSDTTIHLIAYHCHLISASLILTDHDAFAWVTPQQLSQYELTAPDKALLKFLIE